MAFVYLDLIKLAVPTDVRDQAVCTDAQYVVFGSYDLLYYTLPPSSGGSLKWLEDQHERRHDLDWNYERHPVCLYCPQGSYDRMLDIIDNNAHDGCPLVLTMARIAKHPLVSGDPQLDDMLAALQAAIDGKVGSLPDVRMVACWNLGNADFIILSRLRDLSSLRTPYLELGMEGLRFKDARQKEINTRFTSFSSYCAFPAARDKNQNIRVSEKKLREWLEHDSDLQFVAFAEAMVGSKEIVDRYDHRRFLFGDRDYQLFGSLDDNQEQAESVMAVVGELLDPAKSATIQASSLIPSLALERLPEVDTDALPKTYGLTWKEVEKPEAEVIYRLQALRDELLQASGALQRSKQEVMRQLDHCANTLDALYKYAIRLYAAAYEDDVFFVVKGLYEALAVILESYLTHVRSLLRDGDARLVKTAVASLYFEIMLFVSELQHVYTVLAISPHSYMETYYGSMRALNASSKLWVSYCGMASAICQLYPTNNQGKLQECSVLLVPYREKSSQSRRIVPRLYSKSILVHMQLNYQTMFETKPTSFAIAHELGHYVFNTTRTIRAEMLLKSSVSTAILLCFADVLNWPLYALTSSLRVDAVYGLDDYRKCLMSAAMPGGSRGPLRRRLCVNVCSDMDDATCDALYHDMVRTLRGRYQKLIDKLIDGCYADYTAFHHDECAKSPDMVYCLGDDVARAIVRFLNNDGRAGYLRVLSQGIGEANEKFLRHDLPKLEDKHSVRFDRQQVIKLIEYWTLASETGPLDNERGIKAQPDLTPYVKNALTTFREIHSDVFACKVLGFKVGDYLDWVSGFVDSSPSLISQNSDLHRMLVVCETAFGRTKRQRFLRWVERDSRCPFDDDVRSAAVSEARSICSSRHYGYLVEYGRAAARSLDDQNDLIDQDSRQSALLGSIRDFAGDGTGVPQQMWQFWLRAME